MCENYTPIKKQLENNWILCLRYTHNEELFSIQDMSVNQKRSQETNVNLNSTKLWAYDTIMNYEGLVEWIEIENLLLCTWIGLFLCTLFDFSHDGTWFFTF